MINKITIETLKELFIKYYGDCIFLKKPVEVLVTLTVEDFNYLNDDLIKSTHPLLLLIEESEFMQYEPGSVLFSRVSIPNLCEFIIEIGEEFEFGLLDKDQEHGDETL